MKAKEVTARVIEYNPALMLPRQKELYQAAKPETRRGRHNNRENQFTRGMEKDQNGPLLENKKPLAFHKERAKAMGKSPSTIKRLTLAKCRSGTGSQTRRNDRNCGPIT